MSEDVHGGGCRVVSRGRVANNSVEATVVISGVLNCAHGAVSFQGGNIDHVRHLRRGSRAGSCFHLCVRRPRSKQSRILGGP